jgi:hypothetical protein
MHTNPAFGVYECITSGLKRLKTPAIEKIDLTSAQGLIPRCIVTVNVGIEVETEGVIAATFKSPSLDTTDTSKRSDNRSGCPRKMMASVSGTVVAMSSLGFKRIGLNKE